MIFILNDLGYHCKDHLFLSQLLVCILIHLRSSGRICLDWQNELKRVFGLVEKKKNWAPTMANDSSKKYLQK